MKIKDLKQILNKFDNELEICVYDNMGDLYEPIKDITIDKVRKHDDSYAEESGEKFIDSYKKQFIKQKVINIATINY